MVAQSHWSVEVLPSSKVAATDQTGVNARPGPKSTVITAAAVVLLAMVACGWGRPLRIGHR